MKIADFRQTVFVDHDDCNLIVFSVEGWDRCNPWHFSASVDGYLCVKDTEIFHDRAEIYIPINLLPGRLEIHIQPFSEVPVKFSYKIHSIQNWRVDFIASSHVDLGYCGWFNRLPKTLAGELNDVLELIDQHKGFRYLIEHDWWLYSAEKYMGAGVADKLKHAFENDAMELSATHSGIHTHWQGQELLYRSLYYACLREGAKWGINPKTVVYADISGVSWAAVSAYCSMGIRYLVLLPNEGFRLSHDDEKLPRIFRWVAPNGRDSLICLRQSSYRDDSLRAVLCDQRRQYTKGTFVMDDTRVLNVSKVVDSILVDFESSPVDHVPIPFYDDMEKPTDMLVLVCEALNRRWKVPDFGMGLPGKILEDIETRFGELLPEYRGDITDQWGDFATIAPVWMSWRRKAARQLSAAEIAWSARVLETGEPWPSTMVSEVFWKLCEFDEHCWATSSRHPQEMHRANLLLSKGYNAESALEASNTLLQKALGTPDDREFGIWNPLPYSRCASLMLGASYVPQGIACQQLFDGRVITDCIDFLPMERKTFTCGETRMASVGLPFTGIEFETEFYRVRLDREAQKVVSIFSISDGEELLDEGCDWSLGEYLYVTTEGKQDPRFNIDVPYPRGMSVHRGPLATEIIMQSYEEQSGANVECHILFEEHSREMTLTLHYENAVGLMGDYADRYKKNIFFALPFRMPEGHFLTELAGCMVDERSERLPINPRDFVVANNCVAVENKSRGIAVYSADMPIFHLGKLRYNELKNRITPTDNASIYLYAASNRCNQLNLTEREDCWATFSLCILPYYGQGRTIIPIWSAQKEQQPVICAPQGPLCTVSINNSNLRLLTWKPAESGGTDWILRLAETSGKNLKNVIISLPFEVGKAQYADGLEKPIRSVKFVEAHNIIVDCLAFSCITIRISPSAPSPIERDTEAIYDVKTLFSFQSEHRFTTVCFTKCCLGGQFAIFAGDTRVAVVPCDGLYTQFCRITGLFENLTVEREEDCDGHNMQSN